MRKTTLIYSILVIIVLVVSGLFLTGLVDGYNKRVVQEETLSYILVQETNTYYLHKLESWSKPDANTVIFTCAVCKNTIRVPESRVIMYEKITVNTIWANYVDVCSGTAADWHELLGE